MTTQIQIRRRPSKGTPPTDLRTPSGKELKF